MFKLLIIDDNIFYVKNLVNFIGSKIDDVKICGVATSGYEALKKINIEDYDINKEIKRLEKLYLGELNE